MKLKIFLPALAVLFYAGCSLTGPARSLVPAERADIQVIRGKAALVRTLYCDVLVQSLGNREWEYISRFSSFRGQGKGHPDGISFMVVIHNTWKKPLVIENVSVTAGGETSGPLDYSDTADTGYGAERFSVNLRALGLPGRVVSRGEILEEIDFDTDRLDYRLNFITPGDKVVRFYTFGRHAARGEKVTLSVRIKYRNMKKVIDFDMTRPEYRRDLEDADEFEYQESDDL